MIRLRRFFASMTGHMFVGLLLGMTVAALLATLLSGAKRRQDFDHFQQRITVERLAGHLRLLDDSTPEVREQILEAGGPGIRRARTDAVAVDTDHALQQAMRTQGGVLRNVRIGRTDFRQCMSAQQAAMLPPLPPDDDRGTRTRVPGNAELLWPRCWLAQAELTDGTAVSLALETSLVVRDSSLVRDPLFLALLGGAIALLAYVVARLAGQPLKHLADAAVALGRDLQRKPMQVTGPLELRHAAEAFNAMQARLQQHLGERTHMLAAITHDLQTPLTRLRLRLEEVDDAKLRERLVADLAAMQALIREGLELARSTETREQPVALDLDSLLESVVADAADTGATATFPQRCGRVLMLRPLAMQRLFANLVDNAIKYGHQAQVRAFTEADDSVVVSVRDAGPGVPADELETVFDPFVRLETSRSRATGGVGLGLTIARMLAEKEGASLQLSNVADAGGLEARVRWARAPFASRGESHA